MTVSGGHVKERLPDEHPHSVGTECRVVDADCVRIDWSARMPDLIAGGRVPHAESQKVRIISTSTSTVIQLQSCEQPLPVGADCHGPDEEVIARSAHLDSVQGLT